MVTYLKRDDIRVCGNCGAALVDSGGLNWVHLTRSEYTYGIELAAECPPKIGVPA